jgi:hypothetical protein
MAPVLMSGADAPTTGDTWLALTEAELPVGAAYDWAVRPDCGAVVLFSGTVRDHADGRPGVDLLEYEAYESQVIPRLQAIADETRVRYPSGPRPRHRPRHRQHPGVRARDERGIVLNEPVGHRAQQNTGEVLAMGHEAWQMIGRTPGYIVAVRPLRKGAITDFDVTQRMIRLLLQRVGVSRFNRPRVVICVPSAITEVERRAVTEAARRAGAADAQLIEQPMAAAIGAGLPIHEPLGNMVIDIGGGTSETAVISLGGIVALEAVRTGSFDIDAAIQAYVRREYGIAIGERTAEEIKVAIGSAWTDPDEMKAEVRGGTS